MHRIAVGRLDAAVDCHPLVFDGHVLQTVLAVDHIDPGPGLRPNDTLGRLPRGLGESGLIHSLTPRYRTKHLHQPLGPRQAASVGGQDSAVATLHGYNHRERRNH